MKKAILALIRAYQRFFSFPGKTCRFQPTCSEYSYQAIKRYGIIFGGYKGLRRIIRCHPWNKGGDDPLI